MAAPISERARPQEQLGSGAPLQKGTWVLIALALGVGIAFALSTCRPHPSVPVPDLAAPPNVGAEAFHTLLLSRGDITVAPQAENTPLLVRIKSIQATENQQFSYLISYFGVEKGTFNLTDYLCTPNGERLRVPITPVQVNSTIPDSAEFAIQSLTVPGHPAPLPYTALLLFSALAWVGLGLWMFWPRGVKRKVVTPPVPPTEAPPPRTLEDLLRPLVVKASQKNITTDEKGRLEQILCQYWGALLQLDHLNSVEQLRRIQEHKEAGALLRTVEEWLYQPQSKISSEAINQILKPYMNLPLPSEAAPAEEEEPSYPDFQS